MNTEIKPHIWFEDGTWRCGYTRTALISFYGTSPIEAYNHRIEWLRAKDDV